MKMTITGRTLSLLVGGLLVCSTPGCGDDGGGATPPVEAGADAAADDTASEPPDDDTDEPDDSMDDPAEDDPAADDPAPDDDPAGDDPTDDVPAADDAGADDPVDEVTDDPADDPADDEVTDDSVGEAGAPTEEPTVEAEGGAPVATGDIDDLIGAICDWEYRCCDAGELTYRMGPNRADSAACKELFVYELRESNSPENDFVAGSALGLLGQLAFSVDLARVDLNPDGIAECTALWQAQSCNAATTAPLYCAGPVDWSASNACSLNNLFSPKLVEGDECTVALAETAAGNDVECVAGSTCLPVGHAENLSDDPVCVSRSLDGEPCNDNDDCDFNHYCGAGGDCAEKGNEGDPCSFEDPELPAPGAEDAACKLGLKCDPIELVCVNNCSLGYTCVADSECPEGLSCAPVTVGDDSTSFKACSELGDSASARCDTDADCIATRYCDGSGVCSADAAENAACTVNGQCPEGTYCNGICTPFTLRGNPCARLDDNSSVECDPEAVGCIYDETDARLECSIAKRDAGEGCLLDYDCSTSHCEYATEAALAPTCVAGAGAGDACDADIATGVALRCMAGLVCLDGACATQQPAGGACETAGVADPTLCANATCADQWDEFMCTDLPTPESAGGTGLTCDGN